MGLVDRCGERVVRVEGGISYNRNIKSTYRMNGNNLIAIIQKPKGSERTSE